MFSIARQTTRTARSLISNELSSMIIDSLIKNIQNVLRPHSHTHADELAIHRVTAALIISWSNLDHFSTNRSTRRSTSRIRVR